MDDYQDTSLIMQDIAKSVDDKLPEGFGFSVINHRGDNMGFHENCLTSSMHEDDALNRYLDQRARMEEYECDCEFCQNINCDCECHYKEN